jgi:hypothetical protein
MLRPMPKKKRGRPVSTGRSGSGTSAFVRFSKQEFELIEKAIAHQAAVHATSAIVGGEAVTVAAFARHAAVGVAQRILDDAAAEK